jgi:ribosome maturation factor RimP
MSKESISQRVASLAAPLATKLGLELVDVSYIKEGSRMTLRILIDREEGITISDCEAMSHLLGDELDRQDPIKSSYHLEVSSPGIERPLTKEADYIRFAGREIRIKLFVPLDGRKNLTGILRGIEDRDILLENEKKILQHIPLNQVVKANLMYFQEK